MNQEIAQSILILVVLLLFSAFFSSSETAITSIGRGKLLAIQEKNPQRRKGIDWLISDMQRALTVILIGNNLVNIAASAVATQVAISLIGAKGLLLAVAFMTVVIVIFGEILPKSIAILKPDGIVSNALPLLRFINVVFSPLIWITVGIVKFFGSLMKVDLSSQHPFVTREEIEQMVNIGEASGVFEEEERRMIHGVISFEETRVYEIMIPRTDMMAVPGDISISDSIPVFRECGHSRLPVYEKSPDHIVGILYVKDLIGAFMSDETSIPVSSLAREALFVPETMRIADLFDVMRGKRVHMAIVIDEYGGTAGLVTLEDLIEEIVGEIQDEYDDESALIQKEPDGSYLVRGQMGLEDLSEALGYPFESSDMDSVGGLVLSLAGRFPDKGQRLPYGHWEFQVLEVEDHRIKMVRVTPLDDLFRIGDVVE
ncbi:MAG: hemolysin family protein [Thermovirgaceae bacterium]|nr:hemolysin family protein [Synergistales bacterium]MDI9392872.1 hemolysin family protein [Synergistota bacterium]MDY0178292.1 hemolysin family protein [Synergistaceae bacterium]HRW87390.1 hemolysin family protein [Thermovirgaceae bacterium]MDD3829759.1 hemolysin family protein [Synergistales bacterium]